MRAVRNVWSVAFVFFLVVLAPIAAYAADITVFAAASLGDSLTEIEKSWAAQTGHDAALDFAASSLLARQIEASGGADIFISADRDWMDYLDRRNLIESRSRRDLLGNHLVLIEPAASHVRIALSHGFDLLSELQGGRLAIADPAFVPAGKYGRAALVTLGIWNSLADHLAKAENVRVALAYVARGEAPFGIVYTTDALSEPRVRIAATFPDSSHPPIVYPAALIRNFRPLAAQFLQYMSSPRASTIFLKNGFVVLNGPH